MGLTMKRLLPLIASMILLSGCATVSDPRAELLIAQRSFIAVVNSLSELQEADAFDEGEIENITKLIITGDRFLDAWTEMVLDGVDPSDASEVFYQALGELIEFKDRGEKDGL